MIRGTSTTFKIKLPVAINDCTWIRIKFWQPNNPSELLPITRTKDHCSTTDDPTELLVSLTAEETARFSDKYKGKMQYRALHEGSSTVFGNLPWLFTVYPMRDDIIEEDPILPPVNEENLLIFDGGIIGPLTDGD